MKDKLWIVGYILIIILLIAGYLFGGEELRTRMLATGILALVTGVPAVFISLAKGSKKDQEVGVVDEQPEDTAISKKPAEHKDDAESITLEPNMQEDSAEPVGELSKKEAILSDTALPVNDLKLLKKLYDEGLITESEFIQKKKQLLEL